MKRKKKKNGTLMDNEDDYYFFGRTYYELIRIDGKYQQSENWFKLDTFINKIFHR